MGEYMDISKLLSNLKIDVWYKALFYIGSLCLVGSLFVDVKAITNGQLQLLSAGAMCIGLGEWKNHKVASWIKPPNVYTGGPALMSAPIRCPDVLGIVFDLIGIALLVIGVSLVFYSSFSEKTNDESLTPPDEKKFIHTQSHATDRQIDSLVYELYGLTDKEIAIIEESGK
jgi:hypothetical protein